MHDKEQLFQYRRASRVNIYSIGEFEDYFYGYMVPDTSYVKYFDLVPCHAGFLLLLPVKTDPKHVEHPAIREKLFSILHSSYRWSDSLEVPNVGALNKMIVDGRGQDLILMQEALQEKNIGQVAEKAVKDPDLSLIHISRPLRQRQQLQRQLRQQQPTRQQRLNQRKRIRQRQQPQRKVP